MSLFELSLGRKEEEQETEAKKVNGIALATVINVLDALGEARVQLSLPWMPDIKPWARIASPSAGNGYGHYFPPQIGNEVLVAFNQGNIAEPYVLGVLWSKVERPPAQLPTDPTNKRAIRTLAGHDISFDEVQQTLVITSSTQQRVELRPDAVEVTAGIGAASVTLETSGKVTIQATTELNLTAPKVTISGGTVEITAGGTADLKAGGACTILGSTVKIN